MLTKQVILLTGGTGSFGNAFVTRVLSSKKFKGVIRIYSRDEFKQYHMQLKFKQDKRLRFFIGDVRDLPRLRLAMDGADLVVHAAALKHVPILEYNPSEAVKTNINGTQNVIDAAIDAKIKKAILISSDKAVFPLNLYGATKMVAEKIFINGNVYSKKGTIFSVARYGNVMGSRGSVLHLFLKQSREGYLTITDERMTRFWITLEEGVDFVLQAIEKMKGGEIFVPKIPSITITDLAKAIAPNAKIKISGIRYGEKLHEILINDAESKRVKEYGKHFVIAPEYAGSRKPSKQDNSFMYGSDNNKWRLTVSEIKKMIARSNFESL